MRSGSFRVSDAEVRRENANLVRRLCDVATRKPTHPVPSSTPAVFLHDALRRRQVDAINRENRDLLGRLERAKAHVPKVEDTEKMFALHVQRKKFVGKRSSGAEWPDEGCGYREEKPKRKERHRHSRRRKHSLDSGSDAGDREMAVKPLKSDGDICMAEPLSAREPRDKAKRKSKQRREPMSARGCPEPLSARNCGEPVSARGSETTRKKKTRHVEAQAPTRPDIGSATRSSNSGAIGMDRPGDVSAQPPQARCRGVEQAPKGLDPGECFGAAPLLCDDSDDSTPAQKRVRTPIEFPPLCGNDDKWRSAKTRSPTDSPKATTALSDGEYSDTFTALSSEH